MMAARTGKGDPAVLSIEPPRELVFRVGRSALRTVGLALPKEIEACVGEWLP